MRILKFRARCAFSGAWRYGYYYQSKGNHIIRDKDDKESIVLQKTVGQFTGLHDKNGKDIYDGDIIGDWVEVDGKMEQSRQTVFFHEKEGQWMLDNSFHQDQTHFFSLAQELRDFEYEIIGNIHENAELTAQCQFKI